MTEPADFDALELFRALGRHQVEYVTVGGVAVQAYGGQRMTQDLDVVIAASRENMGRPLSTVRQGDAWPCVTLTRGVRHGGAGSRSRMRRTEEPFGRVRCANACSWDLARCPGAAARAAYDR
ncbi:MAG: hypothetical protein JSS99_12885 [Actinobacteria bacterium]|nr:hypothetical protein [Actinomycetota bacterium]